MNSATEWQKICVRKLWEDLVFYTNSSGPKSSTRFLFRGSMLNIIIDWIARGEDILEQLSKPRFFTEFENRGLFSSATQQGRKGRDF